MKSFFKNLKYANFDMMYNIYNTYSLNNLTEAIFVIIVIIQNLSIILCDEVYFNLIN